MSEEPRGERIESPDEEDPSSIHHRPDSDHDRDGDDTPVTPSDKSPAVDQVEPSDDKAPRDGHESADPEDPDGENGDEDPSLSTHDPAIPEDVQRYARFKKVDRAEYDRVNRFLRDRTYITAREWAIARLCADFRTETGVEMTKIGEHLPELVPFMTESYSPQAVNQARHAFEEKVRKAGATFLYGAMCDFFTAEQLDDVLYEATEVARFLLEVEGVELDLDEELAAEDRIATVMREVGAASEELRHEGAMCPACGHTFEVDQSEE